MKPLQIGLLVLVGALGGALIMKFTQRAKPAPAPIVSTAPAPVAQAPETPAPPVAQAAEPKPSPLPEQVESAPAPPARVTHRARPSGQAHSPVTVAQNLPPSPPPTQPQPPASAPVQEPQAAAPPPEPQPAPEAAPEPAEAPPAEPAPSVTLKAGMVLSVHLGESLSSDRNQAGDTFTATLDAPLAVDGFVIAERGAHLEGRVVEVQKSSHVKGQALLALELTRLNTSDGQHVVIQTDTFRKQAVKSTGDDVGMVAAAAGIGAIIGAIAGGGKGAAIGAGAGGAAGVGGVAVTRARPVALPTETKLSFRLKEPVTLTERANR